MVPPSTGSDSAIPQAEIDKAGIWVIQLLVLPASCELKRVRLEIGPPVSIYFWGFAFFLRDRTKDEEFAAC